MVAKHLKTGEIGERATLKHLERKGFLHIESNFRTKTGEIDLIVEKGNRVHFIEVKTVSREIGANNGSHVSYGTHRPEDNVHYDKLRKILNTIQVWLSMNKYQGEWQLDVAAVRLDTVGKKAVIRVIENVILE